MAKRLDFTTLRNRLRLIGTLTVDTGLRIASGAGLGMTGADITVIKDALGHPFIPGSSFKGVLRSQVERLARTIDKRPDVWACDDPLDDAKRCVPNKKMEDLRTEHAGDEAGLSREVYDASCTVCRLFGSPWLASKVLVKDLLLNGEWLGRYPVRDGVGINRDSGTAQQGVLYSYEVVPPGTAFTCEIVAENADQVEQALLLMGLREFQQGRAQLGGGRSRGLGWVRLSETWREAEYVDGTNRAALLDFLDTGRGASLKPEDLEARIKKLREHLA